MYSATLILAFGLTSVYAHGMLTSPPPRSPGPAFGSACGSQLLSQQTSDPFGNIQGEMQVLGADFDASKCNLWQCKGYQFSDNTNIQSFTAGQTVPIKFDIRAPHTGVANVSIVDTATNTVIGAPLISWDVFASNAVPIQADQLSFDITIPSDLGSKCATAGECVIQHFWDARSIDQTYESCIDFTVSGSGSGSAPAPSSSSASSVVTTSAATSSSTQAASVAVSSSTSVSTDIAVPTASTVTTSTTEVPDASSGPTSSASASVAPTDTFTTELTFPTGGAQRYICYVD